MTVIDMCRFPIPDATAESPWVSQLVVRKSRFLAQVCRCPDREASRTFWLRVQALHPDASHNCWAFAAGPPGDRACIGYSDAGEPRGTAGRPMLDVLLHCGIGQICVVVSRWFGGIKLGAGGLARAYQDAVLQNLQTLPLTRAVDRLVLRVAVDYVSMSAVQRLLPDFEAVIEKSDYGEHAELVVGLPRDRHADFEAALAAATCGKAIAVELPQTADPRK